ncbi:MAG: DUF294 nucleotidyltransferase-like domain-containing protein [Oscillochloridaceae bacterium umkhey_bin13]
MEEIVAFLQAYPPFDRVPATDLARAMADAQIEYFAAGQTILTFGGPPAQFLYVVRKGAVDLLREEGDVVRVFDTLEPGEAFGYASLIRDRAPIVTVRAQIETLAYLIPAATFHRLRNDHPAFADFFAASALARLDLALKSRQSDSDPALFQTNLRSLVRRNLVAIHPEMSIAEAAKLMRKEQVSCLLVDLPPVGVLDSGTGIVTDRDLRNRVLAAGLSYDTPVGQIMSAPAVTLSADSLAFEGLLMMLERGIHHLPITEGNRIIGIVTHTDILRRQSRSPLFLPRQLERAAGLEELRHYTDQIADAVAALLDAGAHATDIGRVVAVARDALHRRLLSEAESALGPPPVPYAWLVVGSEGRIEQTLRTDQDNALVYADHAPPEAAAYFGALASMMVDWLVACGFPRCPGNIMATNPEWRGTLSTWQGHFARWIDTPDEEALLRSAIFFDYRPVYGTLDVEAGLRPTIARARGNTLFLARLARAALRTPPPLTFMRGIALDHNRLDLKLRGSALIVDLARLFALEAGRAETNTTARLRASWRDSSLGEAESEGLVHAFELISLLRLRHQHTQLGRGQEPTNDVDFGELSAVERRELKESLQLIARVQRGLGSAYQTGRIV